MTVKDITENSVRWLAAALIGLLCWIGRDTVVQLRRIQTDLEGIKVKLVLMEANAMTPDTVRQLIQLEMIDMVKKREGGHSK